MSPSNITRAAPLPNIPWEARPDGSDEVLWRYTHNPVISRHAIPNANSIFNSAVVPFRDGFAGGVRIDDRRHEMNIHAGVSPNGFDWHIDPQTIRFVNDDPETAAVEYRYDPRVVRLEDHYYVTWCNGYHGPTIGIGYTDDFRTFYQLENAFLEAFAGSGNKERTGQMNIVQAPEIQISTIHQVDCTWFPDQTVHNTHLVRFAVRDDHYSGDTASQVQQCMQSNRAFVFSKTSPREYRQAQVDGSSVERVYRSSELDTKVFVRIKAARCSNQNLGEIGIDPPRPNLIGIRQGVARNCGTDAQVIELCRSHAQAGLDVSQALAISQLCKRHREKLVPTGEALDLVVSVVSLDTTPKFVNWGEVDQLRKNRFPAVHPSSPSAEVRKYDDVAGRRSNRLMALQKLTHTNC